MAYVSDKFVYDIFVSYAQLDNQEWSRKNLRPAGSRCCWRRSGTTTERKLNQGSSRQVPDFLRFAIYLTIGIARRRDPQCHPSHGQPAGSAYRSVGWSRRGANRKSPRLLSNRTSQTGSVSLSLKIFRPPDDPTPWPA